MEDNRILLGMSGGVDSTYAATELRRMGYEVEGAFLKMTEDSDVASARRAAEALDVPLTVVDCTERFRDIVIGNFLSEYAAARTPNPCIVCNRFVKIAALCEQAKKMGISKVATGHYADIVLDRETGRYAVRKAADPRKDQSYMLWRLTQEQLSMLVLPLNSLLKSDIKAKAKEMALPGADAAESQEICFIPSDDYVSYIEERLGAFPKGDFKDDLGKTVGRHEGIIRYTVGQRKGLGIALGRPIFVGGKSVSDNTVTLCSDRELYKRELTATGINLLIDDTLEAPARVEAKIRYRHTAAPATVRRIGEDRLMLCFDEPQRAIAAGQSLVLYDGERVIGGAIID